MPQDVCRLLIWTTLLWLLSNCVSTDRDCDATFSSTTDVKSAKFSSPGWPAKYPPNKRCVYKFVGLSTERVELRFKKFNLQGMPPSCKFDYVDIYVQLSSVNEPLLDAPMLGRFCGSNMHYLPQHLISTKNIIIIIFFSNGDNSEKEGFEGTFAFIDAAIYNVGTPTTPGGCSFNISSRERKRGYLLSPTYPATYPNQLHCKYELHGSPRERIKLTFNDFSIFHGDDYCPFDYVRIKDGRSSSFAEDIGVFCGKYENVTVFSSREFLSIEFVTRSGRVSFDAGSLDNIVDYKFDRRGFNISYEFSTRFIRFNLKETPEATHVIGSECDVRIKSTGGSTGTFSSPGYPSEFPQETVCRFFLDGEMNSGRLEKVKVRFNDFRISGTLDNGCKQGYLGVSYEGRRLPKTINETFCGKLWPPELESRDPRMILHLDTHMATEAKFVAEYHFLADYAIDGKPIGAEGQCIFLFKSDFKKTGSFNTPYHPDNYASNIKCVYVFQPKHNEKILISFDMFSLGPQKETPKCLNSSDYLALNEKMLVPRNGRQYSPINIFCGDTFPAPIIAEREIEFRFVSMKHSSHQGFKARYEFVPKNDIHKGCVHTINSDGKGGVLKSPRFPLKYESRTYCEWEIIASKRENKILVQLETFKIEGKMAMDGGKGCQNAVLRVQHGTEMREICGTFMEEELTGLAVVSAGATERIQFLTASSALGFKGFQLTWTEIHVSSGACYGFSCTTTGYCISSDLRCNSLPNCGPEDMSDEICPKGSNRGPKEEMVQVVHIVIGTSISVFFCVVLLICGVYHRKKFRPRDRHSPETDHVEVRYVAATSGSNTTDRLLTLDKSDHTRSTAHTPERTEVEHERGHNANNSSGKEPSVAVVTVTDTNNSRNNSHEHQNSSVRHNHATVPHAPHEQATTSTMPRPVTAPKIQKVSIV